jgi:hypothetical protein
VIVAVGARVSRDVGAAPKAQSLGDVVAGGGSFSADIGGGREVDQAPLTALEKYVHNLIVTRIVIICNILIRQNKV